MNEIWRKIEGFEKYEVSNLGRVRSLDYKHTGETKVLRPILNRYGYLRINLYKNSKLCSRSIHRLVAQAFILNPENKQQVNHIDANKQNNIVSNLEWCTNLENMQHARDMGLLKLTDEQKKKRSEKQKGKNHPFYGKHHTEETKRKLSESHKGKKISEETKKKLSEANKGENNPMYGKHHSIETKNKISNLRKGEKNPMYGMTGGKNPSAKKAICITTGETFDCIKEAGEKYDVCSSDISKCCTGKRKSAGKHPVTGEKLVWEYMEE